MRARLAAVVSVVPLLVCLAACSTTASAPSETFRRLDAGHDAQTEDAKGDAVPINPVDAGRCDGYVELPDAETIVDADTLDAASEICHALMPAGSTDLPPLCVPHGPCVEERYPCSCDITQRDAGALAGKYICRAFCTE